jgi:hypothetical protein
MFGWLCTQQAKARAKEALELAHRKAAETLELTRTTLVREKEEVGVGGGGGGGLGGGFVLRRLFTVLACAWMLRCFVCIRVCVCVRAGAQGPGGAAHVGDERAHGGVPPGCHRQGREGGLVWWLVCLFDCMFAQGGSLINEKDPSSCV